MSGDPRDADLIETVLAVIAVDLPAGSDDAALAMNLAACVHAAWRATQKLNWLA